MQQVPTDGSYFVSPKGCGQGPRGCSHTRFVRRLNLDRASEGAHVFLCKFHWNKEMQHRTWQNARGIAEQWAVFDFFEPDPMCFEQEDKGKEQQEVLPEPLSSVFNLTSPSWSFFDVHVASTNDDVGSSVQFKNRIIREEIPACIDEAKEFARRLKRTHAVICVFDCAGGSDNLIRDRQNMTREILTDLMTRWKGAVKYG